MTDGWDEGTAYGYNYGSAMRVFAPRFECVVIETSKRLRIGAWDVAYAGLAAQFAPCAATLAENESAIVEELNTLQGQPMDIGGYYQPNEEQAASAMRPCAVFNEALAALG